MVTIKPESVARMNRRGVEMKEEFDVPFPEVTLKINVTADTRITDEWTINKP